MATVTIPVGPSSAYSVPTLELPATTCEINIDLEDGNQTFTSQDSELGTVHTMGRRPLMGRLVFHYSYDSASQLVIVCSTDFPSADGMTLVTMLQGTDQVCIEHAASVDFAADEVSRSWNYRTQLTPGASEVFKEVARNAKEKLLMALKEVPQLRVRVRNLLPELPKKLYHDLCVVIHDGTAPEVYDPTREYESGAQIQPVDSTYGGTETWQEMVNFANVVGSTDDPKPPEADNKWIHL